MAKMLGVWMQIVNPNRSAQDDLNLTVGGTIGLTRAEVEKLAPGQLFNVRIRVMDEDSFSDDLVYTDNTFSIAVRDTNPQSFVCYGCDCASQGAESFRAELRA